MIISLRFPLALIALFSSFFFSESIAQPCFCINAEARNCAVAKPETFTHNASRNVLLEIADNPRSLDEYSGARYKAFWIFGDGNFAYYPHRDSLSDVGTLRQPYTYRRGGTYGVEAALTEKKSNTRPPVRDRRIIQVNTGLAPGDGTPFVQQLLGNAKTADILPSDSMRPHEYETAFAVSAPRDPVITGIYFFYNGKVGEFTTDAALMHELVDVSLPDYAGASFVSGTTSTLGNSLGVALFRSFQNYIFVPISSANLAAMPPDADFTEYRIFPIFKTIWETDLPKCKFLAVVVGSRSVSDEFSDEVEEVERSSGAASAAKPSAPAGFFDPEKQAELERLAGKYFDAIGLNEPAYFDNSQTPVYIRGVYEVEVPMVGSIDPNELEVVQICPLDGGQYLVKMRVQVCNRGIIPEDNVPIRVIDRTAGLFSDFTFLTDSAGLTPTLQHNAATHTWSFVWQDGLEAVLTPTDLAPGERGTPYEPQCLDVYFTLKTTEAGVRRLFHDDALESCATFPSSNAPDECHMNYPIDSTKFSTAGGYKCKDVLPESCGCGFLCILLIVCLLAILLWWFLHKDE